MQLANTFGGKMLKNPELKVESRKNIKLIIYFFKPLKIFFLRFSKYCIINQLDPGDLT